MSLSPQPKPSITDETVQHIIDMIRQGEFAPGDRLPGERQLSQTLRIGRTSLREAIRKLETMGQLEVRQGLGTYVRDASAATIQLALPPPAVTNPERLKDLFEMRQIVEVAAAGLAAERADSVQIMAMRRWLQAIETYIARGDAASVVTADVEFHRQIIIAAGNEILTSVVDSIVHLLYDMRHDSSRIPDLMPYIVSGHRAIMAAIESGSRVAAEQAMQGHLQDVAARVVDYWSNER